MTKGNDAEDVIISILKIGAIIAATIFIIFSLSGLI